MSDEVEGAVDVIEDVVEETVDIIEEAIKRSVSLPVAIGIGILTAGAGFAAGYFFGKRPRPIDLTPEEKKELEEIKAGVAEMKATDNKHPTRVVVDEAAYKARDEVVKLVEPYSGSEDPEAPVTVNKEIIRRSIFAEESTPEDDWDYEVELKARDRSRPYVIHRDEFFEENEFDFTQLQLTYYNGDDKLVDEQRSVVLDHVGVVGELKFGHGSGDPNVVYVRNERLRAEYEVWLDAGRADVEVFGNDMEDVTDIQHAAPRKFKRE